VTPPQLDEKGNPAGGPANRRAKMYLNLRKALEAGRFSLPDKDDIQADLTSLGYRYDSGGRLLMESKAELKKRGLPSPDTADAIALCFSEDGGSGFVRDKKFYKDLNERYQGAYI
jgi:hypothetical protein